jgi:hypothetical protein
MHIHKASCVRDKLVRWYIGREREYEQLVIVRCLLMIESTDRLEFLIFN